MENGCKINVQFPKSIYMRSNGKPKPVITRKVDCHPLDAEILIPICSNCKLLLITFGDYLRMCVCVCVCLCLHTYMKEQKR